MSKLNQSLKKELLRATEPKKLFLRPYGATVNDLPAFKADADCEPSKGYEDADYRYGLLEFFTKGETIELNKFLSRHYDFVDSHGYLRVSGKVGFRARSDSHISIDLPSLTLTSLLFHERKPSHIGVLDRDVDEDLLQAITMQFQSPEYRADAINILNIGLADYQHCIPF
ncbi:hypothetical protein [uncultured Psychrobacter sp.]|uniref:hypothetical protein n=1 Tax=uncultured Psychrobacter sp. TaxID=259303 RepID=UPI0030D9DDEB